MKKLHSWRPWSVAVVVALMAGGISVAQVAGPPPAPKKPGARAYTSGTGHYEISPLGLNTPPGRPLFCDLEAELTRQTTVGWKVSFSGEIRVELPPGDYQMEVTVHSVPRGLPFHRAKRRRAEVLSRSFSIQVPEPDRED